MRFVGGAGPAAVQRAYQVRVGPERAGLAGGEVIWDSGRVDTDRHNDVVYGGPALPRGVRLW